MTFTLRPFNPSDVPALVRLQHAAVPLHPWSEGELARDLERLEPHLQYHITLAEWGGEVVGAANFYRHAGSYHPQRFWLELFVHPERQRRGVGRALYEQTLEALAPLDPMSVSAQVREDDARAVAFAQARGFAEVKRDFESVLDATAFDPSPYAHLEAKLEQAGIGLRTLRELDSPEFRRRFHEVFSEVRHDVPRAEPPTPIAFEFFETNVIEEPDILPDVFVFALRSDRIVGFTGGYSGAKPGWMDTWLTAVRREARGLGVAQAVKSRAIETAKGLGFTAIRTDNDTRNAPMLAINEKMGFARQPAVLTVTRTWGEAP